MRELSPPDNAWDIRRWFHRVCRYHSNEV